MALNTSGACTRISQPAKAGRAPARNFGHGWWRRHLSILVVTLLAPTLALHGTPAFAHGTCESVGSAVFVNTKGRLRVRGVHECSRMHHSISIGATIEKRRKNGTWWAPWGFGRIVFDDTRVVLKAGPGGCKSGVYRVKWNSSIATGSRAVGHERAWTTKARRIDC